MDKKEFKKYQHLERLGTTEVEGIEHGDVWVFPKIDGTNSSVWMCEGKICAGSRNKELSLESDNAGFYVWVSQSQEIRNYLNEYPNRRLFGEWLVPHTLKTYRDDCWRKFYVFDVVEEQQDTYSYVKYSDYANELEEYFIDYVPAICTINNPSKDQLFRQLDKAFFLIKDGEGTGEGIVLKNYDFINKYGRITWAKIVNNEFKTKHVKAMGVSELKGEKQVELEVAREFVTEALVDKVISKISLENNCFGSKNIPQLLNTVYYDIVREDIWEIVKKHKTPTIDFKLLQKRIFEEIKNKKPELF